MPEPFRIFSGWDKRQAEAAEVFVFSVAQNSSIPLEIYYSSADAAPMSLEDGALMNPARCERRGVTAFTYSRFMVPHACGFEGRALFADGCDMLCLGDVAELASWDMQGKPLWVVKHPSPRHVPRHDRARSWTSLMLMDCAKLTGWGVDYVAKQPDDQLMRLRILGDDEIGELNPIWNTLVGEGPETPVFFSDVDRALAGEVRILHWSCLSDPNGGSWIDRSGSKTWLEWREKWRAATGRAA